MDRNGVHLEHVAIPPDAMDRTHTSTAGADIVQRAPTVTSTVLQLKTLHDRQLFTLTVTNNPSASATIASLSSALVAAQATASLLAVQNQQLQIASASAVASVQSAAQASASSVVASISSSAAVALASAEGAVSNANNMASVAMQSASAALASASAIEVCQPTAQARARWFIRGSSFLTDKSPRLGGG